MTRRLPPSASAARRVALAALSWLRGALVLLAAIVVWIEEAGWRPLSAAFGRALRWLHLERAEALLRRAPPRLALALFVLPAAALLPAKVFALWLIHAGHRLLGFGAIIVAKLLGTALVGRLFVLLEPQLRTFPWMRRAIGRWQAVGTALRRSAPWRRARAWRRRLRRAVRRLRVGRAG